MRTLRERLATPGTKIIDIEDAPSYIHNFDFAPDDDHLVVEWTDEGLDFSAEFALDMESPDCRVQLLTLVV